MRYFPGRFLTLVLTLLVTSMVAQPTRAAITDLAGTYTGAWTNVTFGSTGKAVIRIQIAGAQASVEFDMDGFVFGRMDPPLIAMPGTVVGNTIQIDNHGVGIFGDITGSVDAGTGKFTSQLANIPGGFIDRVTAEGTAGNGAIQLNYTVYFPGDPSPTNPAIGVMAVQQTQGLTLTSIEQQGNDLIVHWRGGNPPYQVQVRPTLGSGSWTNNGLPTSEATARVPISGAQTLFIRVYGQ